MNCQTGLQTETEGVTLAQAECEKHGRFEQKVFSIFPGSSIKGRCPVCQDEDRAAEEERARQEDEYRWREQRERMLQRSGIPARFLTKSLAEYNATTDKQRSAKVMSERFAASDNPGRSLVFCGRPGTGKTHLACGIGLATIERRKSVLFATVLGAVRSVKDTYRKDSPKSESDALRDLQSPDLLILDEVGVQVGSEHEKMIVFEVINERYAQCRPTVLISNLDEAELTNYLGERVMDRFREGGAVIAFDWDSHRGTDRQR